MRLTLAILLLLLAAPAFAQPSPKTGGATLKTVSVTASNAAVQACATMTDGCTVSIPADAAVGVWLSLVNAGTACSAVTVQRGILIAPNSGYVCSPYEPGGYCYNWKGQVCLILDSGSTAVAAEVTER